MRISQVISMAAKSLMGGLTIVSLAVVLMINGCDDPEQSLVKKFRIICEATYRTDLSTYLEVYEFFVNGEKVLAIFSDPKAIDSHSWSDVLKTDGDVSYSFTMRKSVPSGYMHGSVVTDSKYEGTLDGDAFIKGQIAKIEIVASGSGYKLLVNGKSADVSTGGSNNNGTTGTGGNNNTGGTGATGGTAATKWSNWLFIQSDKALQYRFKRESGSGEGIYKIKVQYRINKTDAIHCKSSTCQGYIYWGGFYSKGGGSYDKEYRFYFPNNFTGNTSGESGIYTLPEAASIEIKSYSDGSKRIWDEDLQMPFAILKNGTKQQIYIADGCVDNKMSNTTAHRCDNYKKGTSTTIN